MKKFLAVFLCVIITWLFSGCSIPNLYETPTPPATEQNSTTETSIPKEAPPKEQGKLYDYCYSLLSNNQKDIYNRILTAAIDMVSDKVYISNDKEQLAENTNIAFLSVMTDHPELFYASQEYQIFSLNEEKFYIELKYDMDKTSKESAAAALNKRVEEIIADTKEMSTFEKEVYFHDYLCRTVTYTADGVYSRYTAYGALVNGKAVCEGYSRAMQLLCKKAGINCSLVRGTAEDAPHMWNVVEIAGDWYEIDVTWDDAKEHGIHYKYFNLTSAEMRKDHAPFVSISEIDGGINLSGGKYNLKLPECTATKYRKEK